MINKVILVGRVGKDAEVRHLDKDLRVASFTLATDEATKRDDKWETKTVWHHIECWRDQADWAAQYVKQGLLLYIEGKLQYSRYTDKQGVERQLTRIVASEMRMLAHPKAKTSDAAIPQGEDVRTTPLSETDDEVPF